MDGYPIGTMLGSFLIPERADNHPCIQGSFKQSRPPAALIPIMYRQQLALRDIPSGWNKKIWYTVCAIRNPW